MDENGFHLPRQLLTFLGDLERNNTRAWFDEHRDDYKKHFVEPLADLVEELGERLRRKLPGIHAVPRIDGSIFRLNRDTRFSKGMAPYKTNAGVFLWAGPAKKIECPGVYLHIEAREAMVGTGVYLFAPERLDPYRRYVERHGAKLRRALDAAGKAGFGIGGEQLKRVPKGFAADHPHGDLLRYKGLHVMQRFPVSRLTKGGLAGWIVETVEPALPVVTELKKALF